ITDSDDVIRRALEFIDAPLLAALAALTGDEGILDPDLTPDLSNPLDATGGWTEAKVARARELALTAITGWRDRGCPGPAQADRDLIGRIMAFTVGGSLPEAYTDLLLEELDAGQDRRAPHWAKEDVDASRPFTVAVVGAGMSGLLAAYRLAQAKVPYVVIEKNDDLGGTWYDNTYPGCRVDVANHFYSYSCAQNPDWPQHFSSQEVLLDYFRRFATDRDLLDRIRFGTELIEAVWSEEDCLWRLQVDGREGPEQLEVQALIMAVGQLNRPHLPEISGIEEFSGPSFHSARWDHSVDLEGKRVAVVGTGASAAQFIPVVAAEAEQLTIYQRTPNWLVPVPHYQEEIPEGKRWLFRHIPGYNQWYRLSLFYRTSDGLLPATEVDPSWTDERSVGMVNDLMRAFMTAYLEEQAGGDPELIARTVPSYPPFSKRMLMDNGSWFSTLKRDNVELVTEDIERVTPEGVVTVDGRERPADVVVYGTGFLASHFLSPVRIVGRGGVEIHDLWAGDPRAYLGITVPGFPNLFCLYGPNTNIVVNGSIIYFSECEVRYILGCLELLLRTGHGAMDVKRDVHDAYNVEIDEGNLRRVWGVAHVNTWYKNAKGRITQNWPFSLQEYWDRSRRPDPEDYDYYEPTSQLAAIGGR
ncbi:MAG TPA: NAD(P)/FAD-dependent oxidoreductase, partial [Acidimicrobiales bacterium]|nr:NAD(P)/FAD-dependent oxidoreductase [Acidimicrobiales bacterium]